MEDAIVMWARREFGQNLEAREVHSLLNGKHGAAMTKMFAVFTEQLVSKKTGKNIVEICEARDNQLEIAKLEKELSKCEKVETEKIDDENENEDTKEAYLANLVAIEKGMVQRASAVGGSLDCVGQLNNCISELKNFQLDGDWEEGGDKLLEDAKKSDGLVEQIEEVVEEINHLLYEIDCDAKSNNNAKEQVLDADLLDSLRSHSCIIKVSTPESKPVEKVHLSTTLPSLETYKERRKQQSIKLVPKLDRARKLIDRVLNPVEVTSKREPTPSKSLK